MASEVQADNGVNVAALLAAREALTNAPEAANFKWRATCSWKNGTHSHSIVEGFYGLGEEQKHRDDLHVSTPITRRYSPRRTMAPRRWKWCSSVSPVA